MYVTRPLSLYRKSPEAAHEPPPAGPNSGYLVISEDESEAEARCCFGTCKDNRVESLPFPQNKILTFRSVKHNRESATIYHNKAFFIPVLDQPLSSNRYYVILADGKYKGLTCTCSREDDLSTCCFCTCCFCNCINDVKPTPFDPTDLYEQVEISTCRCRKFIGKSIAPDGFPPLFLSRRNWKLYSSTPDDYQLGEAHGVDAFLHAHEPKFNFPIGKKHSLPTVVGKWYCPFIFIREVSSLEEQMKKSMFYEIYLEQFWEEIYVAKNHENERNAVEVNVCVKKEAITLFGEEPAHEDTHVDNGIMWFRALNHAKNGTEVGLSLAVVERMQWEATRAGWDDGKERQVKVERVEEFKEGIGWRKFGCYVLVERFVLKRMDGSLVLNSDFKHTQKIRSKWEYSKFSLYFSFTIFLFCVCWC